MLNGDKIFLRTIEPEDVDLILNWENNPENWRVSNTLVPFSKHLITQYVNSAQDLFSIKQIRFIVCLNATREAIGSLDLFDYDPLHQRVGLGILIEKKYREKGHAISALEIISNYALHTIGVRNLYCNILGNNTGSIQLFEKAGFEKAGEKKNWYNDNNGNWIDEFFYQKQLLNKK